MPLDAHLVLLKTLATRAWYETVRRQYPEALAPHWQASTTASGEPLLTVQITGRHAPDALQRFAAKHPLALGGAQDQQPRFEYPPGRVACVWRWMGVWVEMWHHDIPVVPAPSPADMPKRVTGLFPSGMLPFHRRNPVTVIKEN